MSDVTKFSETPTDPTPHVTLDTPTEAAPAAHVTAVAPARRPDTNVADTAQLLTKHFPALFGAGVIKPIKLRIQADIHQRAPGVFTKRALSVFLQRHTTGTAYLRALVAEGATRIDLDGQPVGEIAPEHRDAAAVELERRRAIVEARKQARREATRGSRHDAHVPQPPQAPRIPQRATASQPASPATGQRPATHGAGPVQPGTSARPDPSQRPTKPDHVPRSRQQRPSREQQTSGRRGATGLVAPQRPHKPQRERELVGAHEQAPVDSPATALTLEQAAEAEARRERALLLRSFEQSPLSKANFGALKGLSEGALDALLTLARQERGSR